MAKKAPMTVATMRTEPAPTQNVATVANMPDTPQKGRPRLFHGTIKTTTIRMTPEVQKALRLASLNHDRPIQTIIMDGIHDQLARLGVAIEE